MPNPFLLQLVCVCSESTVQVLKGDLLVLTGKQTAGVDLGITRFPCPAKCLLHILLTWRKLGNSIGNVMKRFKLTFKMVWENLVLRCMLDKKTPLPKIPLSALQGGFIPHSSQPCTPLYVWTVRLTEKVKSYQEFCIEFHGVLVFSFVLPQIGVYNKIEKLSLDCLPIVSTWGIQLFFGSISSFCERVGKRHKR